jgi:hypothetical protein
MQLGTEKGIFIREMLQVLTNLQREIYKLRWSLCGILTSFFFLKKIKNKKTSLFFLESTKDLCRRISSPSPDGWSSSGSLPVVTEALCRWISVAVAVLPSCQPKKSSTLAVLPSTVRYPLSRAPVAAVHGLWE